MLKVGIIGCGLQAATNPSILVAISAMNKFSVRKVRITIFTSGEHTTPSLRRRSIVMAAECVGFTKG